MPFLLDFEPAFTLAIYAEGAVKRSSHLYTIKVTGLGIWSRTRRGPIWQSGSEESRAVRPFCPPRISCVSANVHGPLSFAHFLSFFPSLPTLQPSPLTCVSSSLSLVHCTRSFLYPLSPSLPLSLSLSRMLNYYRLVALIV